MFLPRVWVRTWTMAAVWAAQRHSPVLPSSWTSSVSAAQRRIAPTWPRPWRGRRRHRRSAPPAARRAARRGSSSRCAHPRPTRSPSHGTWPKDAINPWPAPAPPTRWRWHQRWFRAKAIPGIRRNAAGRPNYCGRVHTQRPGPHIVASRAISSPSLHELGSDGMVPNLAVEPVIWGKTHKKG